MLSPESGLADSDADNGTRNRTTSSGFPNGFLWGTATSAYQVEGAVTEDGRGPSIWDRFAHTHGTISDHSNGDTATDHYHRYKEDVQLMKALGAKAYRFSIAWPRVFPEGTGTPNPKGLDFYNRLVDELLANGIEPFATLYHWDLPQALEQKGGWTNREIIYWFEEYVKVCVQHFGDRVKRWMILNEPMVFTGAGYFLGIHAPGKKGLNNFLAAVHHAAMCQAAGGRFIRSLLPGAVIGTTFSCSLVNPAQQTV